MTRPLAPRPAGSVRVDGRGRIVTPARSSATQSARKRSGTAAEDALGLAHAECLRAGVAYVHKVDARTRMIRSLGGGQFVGVHVASEGVDYRGVMLDGTRREVRIECKSVARRDAKFYLRNVEPVQRDELDAANAVGAVAVLVVRFGVEAWAFDWANVRREIGLTIRGEAHRGVLVATSAYLRGWV